MSPMTLKQTRRANKGHPEPGMWPAGFLLIALLTALIVLAHSLELGVAPVAVPACFLAGMTALVIFVLAHRSGRS